MDMETAFAKSEKVKAYLKTKGITPVPRAPEQHARYIERRGALVRECIHKIISQLEIEGIQLTFKRVLAEAAFMTNALLAIDGSTLKKCRLWQSASDVAQHRCCRSHRWR